jgi:O-acetyl-ADP-ribose deacetylase (regulator of RNase III)
MDIELLRADVSSLKVDAMVNPANPQLLAGYAPRPSVGEAIVTEGGNLFCKFIIHAVVPRVGEGNEETKLRAATWSSLQRAEELALASVAFPAMAAGVFGISYERCARIMLGAAVDFRGQARSLRRVVFCLFGKDAYDDFDRVLRELHPTP